MQQKSWLSELKLSIVNKNFSQIEKLSKNIPHFKTLNESQEALALINEVNTLIQNEQQQILSQMEKLKKTKKFLD